MKTKNTNEAVYEHPLNPEILRDNAELICDSVESNSTVILFKCEECGNLHMRIVSEEDDAVQTTTIH